MPPKTPTPSSTARITRKAASTLRLRLASLLRPRRTRALTPTKRPPVPSRTNPRIDARQAQRQATSGTPEQERPPPVAGIDRADRDHAGHAVLDPWIGDVQPRQVAPAVQGRAWP